MEISCANKHALGTFAGIYATTNGNGEGGTPAYFSNWRYQGNGQAIDDGQYYPSNTGPTVPQPGDAGQPVGQPGKPGGGGGWWGGWHGW